MKLRGSHQWGAKNEMIIGAMEPIDGVSTHNGEAEVKGGKVAESPIAS